MYPYGAAGARVPLHFTPRRGAAEMGAAGERFKQVFEGAGGAGGGSPMDNSRYNV